MSGQAEKILDIARGELGYLEKKSGAQLDDKAANAGSANYTKYWRDMKPAFQGLAWCACFVSWCARKAGISEDVFPTFYDCDAGEAWFIKRDRVSFTMAPKPGYVVFFGVYGDAQHVGLVEKVEGGRVFSIDGNTSSGAGFVANGGAVAEKSYALSYEKIIGYGRPDYEEDKIVSDIEFEKMVDIWLAKRGRLPVADNLAPADFEAAIAAGLTDGTRPQAPASRQEVAAMS